MREFHLPVWLGAAPVSHSVVFALLFFIESIARTILLTVVPLQAYRILGDAQQVSLLYFVAGLIGIAGSLTIPWLVRRLRRRRVFTLGSLAMVLAAILFIREDAFGLFVGLALMAFATSCLGIAMNLYVMDHIQRRDLNRFEPMRMFLSASAWAVGPWLGVWLAANVQAYAPFVLTMASSAATLGFFWYLRLSDNPAVASAPLRSPNPLRYLPRFFGQPRLRLAWALAVGRSGWWQLFYVYGPIYVSVRRTRPI
jgi:MFS family permease